MNARQKVKKLKKEIEALKEDKSIHGKLWLKIDGPMRAKFCPISPEDRLIIVNSEKLDKAVEEVR